MLSFNNDLEFFNWLMSAEFRENQYSEQELLYMLKRFREEYRSKGKRKAWRTTFTTTSNGTKTSK